MLNKITQNGSFEIQISMTAGKNKSNLLETADSMVMTSIFSLPLYNLITNDANRHSMSTIKPKISRARVESMVPKT